MRGGLFYLIFALFLVSDCLGCAKGSLKKKRKKGTYVNFWGEGDLIGSKTGLKNSTFCGPFLVPPPTSGFI